MSKVVSFGPQELVQEVDSTNQTNSTPAKATKASKFKNFLKSIPNKFKKKPINSTLELNINNYAESVVKNAKYKSGAYFNPHVTLPVFYNSKLFDLINSIFKTSYNNDNAMKQLHDEYRILISNPDNSVSVKEFYINIKNKLKTNLSKYIIDIDSNKEYPLIEIKISRLVEDVMSRIDNINATYRNDNPIDELVNLYIVHKIIQDKSTNWTIRLVSPLKYVWNLYPSTKIALFLVIIIYVLIVWFQIEFVKTISTKVFADYVVLKIFVLILALKSLINLILPEYLTDMYYLKQTALSDASPQLNAANDDEMRRSKCTINNRGVPKEIDCDLLRYLETGPQGVLKTAIKVVNQHAAEMTKLHQGAFKNIEEIAQGNYETPGQQALPSDRPVFSAKDLGDDDPAQEQQSFNTVDPQQL